jgi:HK97 family phage portal protein
MFGRTLSITTRGINADDWMKGIQSANASSNGVITNIMDAYGIATVMRCVDLISNSMGSIGLDLFEKKEDGMYPAENNDLYDLITIAPNPETTSFDFISFLVVEILLTKAGVIWIERAASGKVEALWNLPSCYCSDIVRNTQTGERYITFSGDWRGKSITKTIYDKDMIWIPGRRISNPDKAVDVISLAARSLGLTSKLDLFATNYFDSGTNPSGILTYDGNPRDEVFKEMIARFRQEYSGAKNQNKVMGLTSKMKFETLDKREPDKAQALESRKFQVSEICRIFGVPPHLVFEMERATYSNTEQLNVEFVQYGLDPVCAKIEQAMALGLFSRPQRRRFNLRFQTIRLIQGDIKTRVEFYSLMRNGGIMNADEIRARENLPRIKGGDGQEYLINGAMIPLKYAKENRPKNSLPQKGGAPNGDPNGKQDPKPDPAAPAK